MTRPGVVAEAARPRAGLIGPSGFPLPPNPWPLASVIAAHALLGQASQWRASRHEQPDAATMIYRTSYGEFPNACAFLFGLGLGGFFIGKRIDRARNPLAVYGFLEVGVAVFAGLTPVLFWLVRHLYLAIGGASVLGPFLSKVFLPMLASVVLSFLAVL